MSTPAPLLTLVSVVLLAVASLMVPGVYGGTTPNLKDIFVGRCWEFQTLTRPELFTNGRKDCNKLWTVFSNSFMYKDPCNMTEEDFREYVTEAAHPIPPNTAILWEELYPFTYKYSDHGTRATALADYLAGHIAQGIRYCGSQHPPGIDYIYCPPYMSCPGEVTYNFWKELSFQFSAKIQGFVRAALNGSLVDKPAFQNKTIFADQELVNLVAPRVTHLEIWLVHDVGKPKTEICGQGSLKILEAIALSQGITYSCIDDPPETLHLLCVSNPTAAECQPGVNEGSALPNISSVCVLLINLMTFLLNY